MIVHKKYNIASSDSISCNILLQWIGEHKATPLKSHTVPILGTTEERCSFTIYYYPKEESGDAYDQEKVTRKTMASKHFLVSNYSQNKAWSCSNKYSVSVWLHMTQN